MPNWCYTTYKCVGKSEELENLYKVLKDAKKSKKPVVKNDFGKLWIGCIITLLNEDWQKYRCRGHITFFSLDDNVLTISQETAWCEQEGFREVIEKKFPSIKVYYRDEEIGNGVYYTNDKEGKYFPDKYMLDACIKDEYYYEYYETKEELLEDISKILETKITSIEEAEKYNETFNENTDDYINVIEITVGDD